MFIVYPVSSSFLLIHFISIFKPFYCTVQLCIRISFYLSIYLSVYIFFSVYYINCCFSLLYAPSYCIVRFFKKISGYKLCYIVYHPLPHLHISFFTIIRLENTSFIYSKLTFSHVKHIYTRVQANAHIYTHTVGALLYYLCAIIPVYN